MLQFASHKLQPPRSFRCRVTFNIDDLQPKTSCPKMDRAPCDRMAGDADAGFGDGHQHGFVCPFVRSEPIRHNACTGFKLTRVTDVGLHLRRKHPQEAERMKEAKEMRMEAAKRMGKGTGEKKTDKERWYALWDDLFPGQPRPASPYAGTEIVELVCAVVMGYLEKPGAETLSADVRMGFMRFLEHVKTGSSDQQLGKVSGQDVSNITGHRQGINVQASTHQQLQLSAYPSGPAMCFLQQPDPQLVHSGVGDTSMFGAVIESQVPMSSEVNGQHVAPAANRPLAHQLLPDPWMNFGLANGHVGPLAAPLQTSAVDQGWTGSFQDGGLDESWGSRWDGGEGYDSL